MTYKIYVGGDAGNEEKILSRLSDISVNKNPTALSDWSVTIPYQPSIDENLLDEIYLYFNDEKLFRGYLESAQHDDDNSTTKLKGRGSGVELLHQTTEVTYDGVPAHAAIGDFWNNHTDAEATVQRPPTTSEGTSFGATGENSFRDLFTFDNEQLDYQEEDLYFEPFYVDDDGVLRMHQTGFTFDELGSSFRSDGATRVTGDQYSAGEAARLDSAGDEVEFHVPFDYYVAGGRQDEEDGHPGEGYEVYARLSYEQASNDDITLAYYNWWADNMEEVSNPYPRIWDISGSGGPEWVKVWDDNGPFVDNGVASMGYEEGIMKLVLQGDANNGSHVIIDAVAVVDANFNYEASDSLNEDGYYSRPETYSFDAVKQTDEISTNTTDFYEVYLKSTERHSQFRNAIRWFSSQNGTTGERGPHTSEYGDKQSASSFLYDDLGEGEVDSVRADVYFSYPADEYTQSGDSVPMGFSEISFRHTEVDDIATIEGETFSGTKLDILQDLHDTAGYRFVEVEPNGTYESFPIEARHEEPDWRLLSSSRKIDFTDYGNKYTVRGTDSNGNEISVTETDFGEVDEVGNEIHRYERVTGASSKAELRRRARRLLQESTNQRKQSGSATATPKFIPPGYNYPVSKWAECFTDSSHLGWNALCLDGPDGRADRIQRIDDPYSDNDDEQPRDGAWEFLVRPEMDHLSDDEYMVLASTENGDFIRIYGDGSVDWTPPGTSHGRLSTPAGTVAHQETSRLSFHYDVANSQMRILEGENEAASTSIASAESREYGSLWLGARWADVGIGEDSDATNAYKGGLDDIRYWLAEDVGLSYDFSQPYQELDASELPNNGVENEVYYRLNDEQHLTRAPNEQLRPVGANVETLITDDFEDGDLSEYGSTNYDVTSSAAYQGSYGLEVREGDSAFSTSGLDYYPSIGDEITARFRLDDFPDQAPRWELAFASQGLSLSDNYSFRMEANNVYFDVWENGSRSETIDLWSESVSRTTVDDFEDGDLSEYSGAHYAEVTSSAAHDGNYGVHIEEFGEIYSAEGDGLNAYPEKGDEFEFWIRNNWAGDVGVHQLHFACQADHNDQCYSIRFDRGEQAYIRRRDSRGVYGGHENLVTAPDTVPGDEWLRVRVRWDDGETFGGDDGDIIAQIYNESGTLITTMDANDTSYNRGGIGWRAGGYDGSLDGDGFNIINRTEGGGTGGGDPYPGADTIIDDYEDADLSEYLDSGYWDISTVASYEGDYGLQATGYGYRHSELGGGLNAYPERGDEWEVYLMNTGFDANNGGQWRIYFGAESPMGTSIPDNGYYEIRFNESAVRLSVDDGSSVTLLDIADYDFNSLALNRYRVYVDWDTQGNGDINVEVQDLNGNVLASLSGNDTLYDEGGIGFWQNAYVNETYVDSWRILNGSGAETSWNLGDWYELSIDWSQNSTFDIEVTNLSNDEQVVDAKVEDENEAYVDGGIGFVSNSNVHLSWDEVNQKVVRQDTPPRAGIITGASYDQEFGRLEEVSYTLGNDAEMSLSFDLEGLDKALSDINRRVQQNREEL